MTTRKRTTTRKTTTPKPQPVKEAAKVEPVVLPDPVQVEPQEVAYEYRYEDGTPAPAPAPAPVQPPVGPYPYHYPPRRGISPLTLVLVAAVAFFGYQYWKGNQPSKPVDGDDGREGRAKTALVNDIRDAMEGNDDYKKHAKYLHYFCRRIAGQLPDDFASDSPVYDTRAELAALVGMAGYFATGTAETKDYRDLPKVIESWLEDSLGEEGGKVDVDTEEKFVEGWEELAAAFKEVGE